MVDNIESAILRDNYALGVFLDAAGAFDNLSIEASIRGMQQCKFPKYLIKWYGHYLSNRTISVDLKGVQEKRKLTRGTPQGGVLSPLIWNLALESLLNSFNGPLKLLAMLMTWHW
jgi:retron-type reverse transcriptase